MKFGAVVRLFYPFSRDPNPFSMDGSVGATRADRVKDVKFIQKVLSLYPGLRAEAPKGPVQLSFPFMLDPRNRLRALYAEG